jgi:serine/threonine protein kinase
MKFMHSANILHRDLKPRNLLVNANCDLKICDFGLARADLPDLKVRGVQMTDYVATRWYRAPEVLLAYKKYTSSMDVWSLGCILGELLLRRPVFPGTDTQNQLDLIFQMIGFPTQEDIDRCPNPKSREKLRQLPHRQGAKFNIEFAESNPDAVDLLR